MSKIYDCFTYNNEELILKLRLETLHQIVDTFVIAESPFTHTGRPKPLHLQLSRFEKFRSKIVHLIVDDIPLEPENFMLNENYQRNALLRGLKMASPEDRIIISDVDEIPSPDAIRRYHPWFLYGTFMQRFYCYYLNNLAVQKHDPVRPRWWIRAKITTMKHLTEFFQTPQNLRLYKTGPGIGGQLKYLHRKLRHQRLSDGGWHFSWIMTPQGMIDKIESVYETQFDLPHIKNTETIKSAIASGLDILGKGERFRLVNLDAHFPQYLVNNFDQFRSYYCPPNTLSKE